MAEISIVVGPVTSTITVSDSRAQEILTDYAAAYGIDQTGTTQARLDAVTRHIARHVQEAENAYSQRTGAEAERERLRGLLQERTWES